MKPIIIGAGRGSRLNAMTADQPKPYVEIGGRRILDWVLDAFSGAGLDGTVYIGGYQIDRIRSDYPSLTFCHNADWEKNNILASLFHAEEHMADGFVCSYADILFRDSTVQRALAHSGDIVLCIDTDWRERYKDRSDHPEDDAEKVTVAGGRVTRIHRDIDSADAGGEYIGVAKISARGAEILRAHYHRARESFAGRPWRESPMFEKAYLIHLLQEMIEQDETIHYVTTDGDYMEIDTEEDYGVAKDKWFPRFSAGSPA